MSTTQHIEPGRHDLNATARKRRGTPRSRPLSRFARGIKRAPGRFVVSLHAAQMVARHAEHYYHMSDPQLARAGLSRETVPATLLRELDARRAG